MNSWWLYVVRCADGSLYTGISTDVSRRIFQHNCGKGAKYTSARRPVTLQIQWLMNSRSQALKAEYAFKQLSKTTKERYIREQLSTIDIFKLLKMEISI
jgi:putative endonuclease